MRFARAGEARIAGEIGALDRAAERVEELVVVGADGEQPSTRTIFPRVCPLLERREISLSRASALKPQTKAIKDAPAKRLVISPLIDVREQIQPTSVDLRLGTEFSIIRNARFPFLNLLEEPEQAKREERLDHRARGRRGQAPQARGPSPEQRGRRTSRPTRAETARLGARRDWSDVRGSTGRLTRRWGPSKFWASLAVPRDTFLSLNSQRRGRVRRMNTGDARP